MIRGPLGRCGPQPAAAARQHFRYLRLADPEVGTTPAVQLGHGRTVVILLHQTDGGGLCGWLPFMGTYADEGFSFLALDLCPYGESHCTKVRTDRFEDADQTDVVDVAIRHATSSMGARRVVVMGASMGGSVALMSAASLAGVNAAVDLSGPSAWPGVELARRGRAIQVPVLVGMATEEGPDEVSAARQVVRNSPEGSRLLLAEQGHGYELLNGNDGEPLPFGQDVMRWIQQNV